MEKIEYKCIWIWGIGKRINKKINELGEQGWELIEVNFNLHYFKRPKE